MSDTPAQADPGEAPLTFFGVLLTAAWLGTVAGLAQVVIRELTRPWTAKIPLIGPHSVWMAPLATAGLLVAGALGLALIALAVPPRWRLSFQLAGLAVPALWSILLMFPRIDDRASLLLSAGIAVQVARTLAPRRDRFAALVRRTLPAMVLVLAGAGLGIAGWRLFRERRGLAAVPPADRSHPNVLLVVVDTERAASLSLYGRNRPTSPWLDRFATSGTVFDWAIAPAPWTLPSHASIFTGRYAHQLSAELQAPLDNTYPTLAERMKAMGYATAGFVGNTAYGAAVYGLGRGFLHYEDFVVSPEEILLNSTLGERIFNAKKVRNLTQDYDILARRRAPNVTASFLSWLDRDKDRDRPWFVFLNYFDVHDPYLPPAPFDTLYGATNKRDMSRMSWGPRAALLWNFFPKNAPRALIEGELNAYEAGVTYVDDQLDRLFEGLARRGVLDRTLVILTSDHGEEFGEHPEIYRHGTSVYTPQVHVPLVLRLPGRVPAGRRVGTLVTLQDLSATVLDVTNAPPAYRLPGHSLAWAIRPEGPDTTAPRTPVVSSLRKYGDQVYFSVAGEGFYYIREVDRQSGKRLREQLYDLTTDPVALHDLAGVDSAGTMLAQLRGELDSVFAVAPPLVRP